MWGMLDAATTAAWLLAAFFAFALAKKYGHDRKRFIMIVLGLILIFWAFSM